VVRDGNTGRSIAVHPVDARATLIHAGLVSGTINF
jgi:hypothetical protein